MVIVRGIPYRLEAPGEYDGDDVMRFKVEHPGLPRVDEGGWEDAFEAKNGMIDQIQKAAKAGAVVSLRCSVKSLKSNAGKAWTLFQVREVLSE